MGNIDSRTSNWTADDGVRVRVLRDDGEDVGSVSRIAEHGVHVKVVASGSDGGRSLTAVDGERVDVQVVHSGDRDVKRSVIGDGVDVQVVDSKGDATTCAWNSVLNQSICSDDGSTGSRGEPVKIILRKPLPELKRLEVPKGELEVERRALESSRKIFHNKVPQLRDTAKCVSKDHRRVSGKLQELKDEIERLKAESLELIQLLESRRCQEQEKNGETSSRLHQQGQVEVCTDDEWDRQCSAMQDVNAEGQDREKGQGLVRGEGLITKDRRTKWKERSLHEPSKSRSEDNRNSCDGVKLKECTRGRKAIKDKRERGGHVAGRKNMTGFQQEQRWRKLRCSA